MKVLVTGSNGLLGQKLLTTLSTDKYTLFAVDLADSTFVKDVRHVYTKLDLCNRKSTHEYVRKLKPEVIVHTAAMTNVDQCELRKEDCWNVNVNATDNLVQSAEKTNSKLIYVSTDYVFDGKTGPYNEDDKPNPISYYGRSKLAAENILRGSALDWTIARTIVLYGLGLKVKSSFVTWLIEQLRAEKSVRIVNDQWGNTTIADDLAAGIERLIILKKNGIYHIGGRDFLNRYEFSCRIADYFGLNKELIIPISTSMLRQPAKRPLRSGLEIDKAERDLYISFRTIEQSLELYKKLEKLLQVDRYLEDK